MLTVTGLALLVVLLRAYVVAPFTITSGSMEVTLQRGDRVLVDRLSPHLRGLRRGDVVVFAGAAFVAPDRTFVKRVIGVAGDRVACCDRRGRLTVNGEPLDEREYLYRGDTASELRFDVAVPDGALWVMGDHRSESRDSRAYLGAPGGGAVPANDVAGRVMGIVWPLSRLTGLPSYAAGELGEGRTR